MKKFFSAAIAACLLSFGASAQINDLPCQGCNDEGSCYDCEWEPAFDVCEVPICITLVPATEINCWDCGHLSACVNTQEGYTTGVNLGSANFVVWSTGSYDGYLGLDDLQLDREGGGSPLQLSPTTGVAGTTTIQAQEVNLPAGATSTGRFTSYTPLNVLNVGSIGDIVGSPDTQVFTGASAGIDNSRFSFRTGPIPTGNTGTFRGKVYFAVIGY